MTWLPRDVLFIICSMLDYPKEINSMCEVFPQLSNDKQLWAHIFKRQVKEHALLVPSELRSIDDVEAHDIESWLKNGFALGDAYRMPFKKLSVRKIHVRPGRRVTWLKLVFGRWCLLSASDDEESQLSLWEVPSGDAKPREVAEVYLEAPVLDGQTDYSTGEVRFAVTVGAAKPYILINGMYSSPNGNILFQQLGAVQDASHVQVLRRDLIGFAVQTGDDLYPCLKNWRSGETCYLQFPNVLSRVNSPLPIESCKAMTIWNDLVVLIYSEGVHIFRAREQLDSSASCAAQYLLSLPFREPIWSGQFLQSSSGENESLQMLLQFRDGASLTYAFVSRGPRQQDVSFSITEYEILCLTEGGVYQDTYPFLYSCGTSGKVVLTCTPSKHMWRRPNLFWWILGSPQGDKCDDTLIIKCESIPLDKDNLPLLHLLSCADFDDGHGILAMSAICGDVRIVSVEPESIITSGSIPKPHVITNSSPTRGKIFDAPAQVDLPPFYNLRRNYGFRGQLPSDVVARLVSDWQDPRIGTLRLGDWTNNWIEHECIWDWIMPLSRWGPLDREYMTNAAVVVVRTRLQALGDITPVMYHSDNHCEVVLRAGQRMFYCRSRREGEDTDDFEIDDICILGVLPLTYDQFVDDPAAILPLLSRYDVRCNLRDWDRPNSQAVRRHIAMIARDVIEYIEEGLKEKVEISAMEGWSDTEWDAQNKNLNDRYYRNLALMNEELFDGQNSADSFDE